MKAFYGLLAVALVWVPVRADDARMAEGAQRLLAKNQQAVVRVKVTLRIKIAVAGQEQNQEVQVESNGTAIGAKGLTAVSLASIVSTSEFEQIKDAIKDLEDQFGVKIDVSITPIGVKLISRDGREIPAKIVLRDKELGLGFLLPTDAKAADVPYIKIDQSVEPALFDDLFVLRRLGKTLHRESAIAVCQVEATLKKPRPCLVCSDALTEASLGCPAFDGAGHLVGIVTIRMAARSKGAALEAELIVLPAAELAAAAREAGATANKRGDAKSR